MLATLIERGFEQVLAGLPAAMFYRAIHQHDAADESPQLEAVLQYCANAKMAKDPRFSDEAPATMAMHHYFTRRDPYGGCGVDSIILEYFLRLGANPHKKLPYTGRVALQRFDVPANTYEILCRNPVALALMHAYSKLPNRDSIAHLIQSVEKKPLEPISITAIRRAVKQKRLSPDEKFVLARTTITDIVDLKLDFAGDKYGNNRLYFRIMGVIAKIIRAPDYFDFHKQLLQVIHIRFPTDLARIMLAYVDIPTHTTQPLISADVGNLYSTTQTASAPYTYVSDSKAIAAPEVKPFLEMNPVLNNSIASILAVAVNDLLKIKAVKNNALHPINILANFLGKRASMISVEENILIIYAILQEAAQNKKEMPELAAKLTSSIIAWLGAAGSSATRQFLIEFQALPKGMDMHLQQNLLADMCKEFLLIALKISPTRLEQPLAIILENFAANAPKRAFAPAAAASGDSMATLVVAHSSALTAPAERTTVATEPAAFVHNTAMAKV